MRDRRGRQRREGHDDGVGEKGSMRRLGADFALAFVLFWAVALFWGAGQDRAYAVYLPTVAKEAIAPKSTLSHPASLRADQPTQSVHKGQTRPAAGAGAVERRICRIVALNLGFWRHLRRVYASPRRSVWRRGTGQDAGLSRPPPPHFHHFRLYESEGRDFQEANDSSAAHTSKAARSSWWARPSPWWRAPASCAPICS